MGAQLVEVVSVKGHWRRTGSQMDALSALVEKRSRSRAGAVTVTLRAYHSAVPSASLEWAAEGLRLECNAWDEEGANYARQGRVQLRDIPQQRQRPPSLLDELAELFD